MSGSRLRAIPQKALNKRRVFFKNKYKSSILNIQRSQRFGAKTVKKKLKILSMQEHAHFIRQIMIF